MGSMTKDEINVTLFDEVVALRADRDQWKGRADQLSEERDEAMSKLEEQSKLLDSIKDQCAAIAAERGEEYDDWGGGIKAMASRVLTMILGGDAAPLCPYPGCTNERGGEATAGRCVEHST